MRENRQRETERQRDLRLRLTLVALRVPPGLEMVRKVVQIDVEPGGAERPGCTAGVASEADVRPEPRHTVCFSAVGRTRITALDTRDL